MTWPGLACPQGLPRDGRPSTVAAYAAVLLSFALLKAWPAPAFNNPAFAEVVPPRQRSLVYAFDRCFEGEAGQAVDCCGCCCFFSPPTSRFAQPLNCGSRHTHSVLTSVKGPVKGSVKAAHAVPGRPLPCAGAVAACSAPLVGKLAERIFGFSGAGTGAARVCSQRGCLRCLQSVAACQRRPTSRPIVARQLTGGSPGCSFSPCNLTSSSRCCLDAVPNERAPLPGCSHARPRTGPGERRGAGQRPAGLHGRALVLHPRPLHGWAGDRLQRSWSQQWTDDGVCSASLASLHAACMAGQHPQHPQAGRAGYAMPRRPPFLGPRPPGLHWTYPADKEAALRRQLSELRWVLGAALAAAQGSAVQRCAEFRILSAVEWPSPASTHVELACHCAAQPLQGDLP